MRACCMLMRRLHSMLDSLLHSEVLCGHLRRARAHWLHPDDWLQDNLRERPRNDQPGWKPRVLDDSRGVEVLRSQCVIPACCSCSEMLWDIPFYPPSCKNPLASFWCSTSRGFSACFVLLSTKNRNTIPVVASRT